MPSLRSRDIGKAKGDFILQLSDCSSTSLNGEVTVVVVPSTELVCGRGTSAG